MIAINWSKTLPVIVSILIIIAIAILRNYSKTLSAIVAVMPMNIPLGMWIIYAGAEDKQKELVEFSQALFINIIPTLIFMLVVWQLSKAGYSLIQTIVGGYIVWGIAMGVVLLGKHFL
ncbi:MAG: hypothetical protein Kow00117_00350 [Phototrophicales bacterium]